MRILNSIVTKKLQNEQAHQAKIFREYSLYEHIAVYMHAVAYLGVYDPDMEKKVSIWRMFISCAHQYRDSYYQLMMKYKHKEDAVIVEFLTAMEDAKNKDGGIAYGSHYIPFTLGMLSYEIDAS